jgi:aspartyl-tRNA(Asn)/glutamyl-tRNA(Gln) amidotransferase subunit A
MPLAFEVSGRPFNDEVVLGAGHAYQRATDWRSRRPPLAPGRPAPPVEANFAEPAPCALDERLRTHFDMLAERAGFSLTPAQRAELYESAPHALAMAQRIWAIANKAAGTEQ